MMLYVEDAEAWVARAVAAGATLIAPVEDKPSDGDRRGGVRDPFGITWWIATRTRNISRAQLQQEYDAQTAGE